MDKFAFIITILSFLMGAGSILGELTTAATTTMWQLGDRLERKIVPLLAALAQRTLIVAGILLTFAIGTVFFFSEKSVTGLIATDTFFFIFGLFCVCGFAALGIHQDQAKARFLYDEEGNLRLSPDQVNGEDNPFAGEPEIDEREFKPGALSLGATVGAIFAAFMVVGIGLIVIAHEEQSRMILLVASALIFLAVSFVFLVALGLGWLASKGGGLAAWTARLGLSQALLPLAGITTLNVNRFTEGLRAPEWYHIRSAVVSKYAGIVIPFAVYMVVVGAFLNTAATIGVSCLYGPALIASLVNGYYNPLQERARRATAANSLIYVFSVLIGGVIVWNIMPENARKSLTRPFKLLGSFLIGDVCLPVSGGWMSLFVSSLLILLALRLTKNVRAGFPAWAKIGVGAATVIACLVFPLWNVISMLAEHDGNVTICMIGSKLKPKKAGASTAANTGEQSSESSRTGQQENTGSAAETPKVQMTAPAKRYHHATPKPETEPEVDSEGLVKGLREDAEEAMRRTGAQEM